MELATPTPQFYKCKFGVFMLTSFHRMGRDRSKMRSAAMAATIGITLSVTLNGCEVPNAATANPAATSRPVITSLARIPWDGGPAYWNNFPAAAAAGWTDPSFFPIAVFMGKAEDAAQLRSVGINTYLGVEHDGSPLSAATGKSVFVIPQDEWMTEVGHDPRAVGWFVSDECDIGIGCSGGNASANLIDQKQKVSRIRGQNDGRFTIANYSNGVLDTYWAQGTMAGLMNVVDVASVDKYAYTSPFVDDQIVHSPHWPTGANAATSAAYGWLVDRMRSYQDPAGIHPNWVFVESAMPLLLDKGSRTISLEQIEGAAWSAIIHESRGLTYFQHNNDGNCGYYSLVDCSADRISRIRAINEEITALAPIINTQSYQYAFNSTTDTMLKVFDGSAYIFASTGLGHSPGPKTFTLPGGVTGSTIEVVGEHRSLNVVNGAFTDTFSAEYSHHTYKVAI